ncbi:hypothetical protein ACQR50_05185 [Sphingomonas sp. Xoc002]|uniref:hypothetical protein n=1 Tax=Sphingomonas sp. Xoc002 TaxID=2837624 RepID=UPI003D167CFC
MLFSFGFLTLTDLLSWIILLTLGAKAVATIVMLMAGRHVMDQPGWGSVLWWLTKLTPVIAIPCAITLAVLRKQNDATLVIAAMALFVIIAVPLKIRQRRARISHRHGDAEAV